MKFIVDEMLGKLARWLRILGYDTECPVTPSDDELVRRSIAEDRLLLTRDTHLVENAVARRSLLVRSVHLEEQLAQVVSELNLRCDRNLLFSRCLECNEKVIAVSHRQVRDEVPAYIYETQTAFHKCPRCNKIYWRGTHWQSLLSRLSSKDFTGFLEGPLIS